MPDVKNESDERRQALLTDDLGREAQEAVDAVAEAILTMSRDESLSSEAARFLAVPSLTTGFGGPALLCAHLELRRPGQDFGDAAVDLTNRALDVVAEHPLGPSFYDGFTGVAWLTDHLQGLLFDSRDATISKEVDAALLQVLSQEPWTGEYDVSRGLVGLGVYALDRLPEPTAVRCLDRVVQGLEETAEERSRGLGWYTPPRPLPDGRPDPDEPGYYDLGVAHGLAGVIGFLGSARLRCSRPATLVRIDRLLDGAVRFLQSCRLEPEAPASFPSIHIPGRETAPSRAAWCQGDAGIAATLLLAARATERDDWRAEALDVARKAAQRGKEGSWVVDAGLCHGAAGLGHLFHRFFQCTGEEPFAEAAKRWFREALSMRRPGQGVGGFSAWSRDSEGQVHWRRDPGFLTGASGVALALLAALGDSEPGWDRLLLLPR